MLTPQIHVSPTAVDLSRPLEMFRDPRGPLHLTSTACSDEVDPVSLSPVWVKLADIDPSECCPGCADGLYWPLREYHATPELMGPDRALLAKGPLVYGIGVVVAKLIDYPVHGATQDGLVFAAPPRFAKALTRVTLPAAIIEDLGDAPDDLAAFVDIFATLSQDGGWTRPDALEAARELLS